MPPALSLAGSASPSWWAGSPATWLAPELWLRALGVLAACTGSLYAWQYIAATPRSPASRALSGLAVLLALASVLRFAAPRTPIGDWQILLWTTDAGKAIGKWYGGSLAHAAFHHSLGRAFGWTPVESVRCLSALCGAATAFVFGRIAATLGLPRVLPAWPCLYAAAFGVVGVGLGHVEIYAVVALVLACALYTGLCLLESPRPLRAAAFSLATGAALVTYLGHLLLVPLWLGAALALALRVRDGARPLACSLLVVAVTPLVSGLALFLGPVPAYLPLGAEWAHQLGGGDALNRSGRPLFLPLDVHASVFTNLIAPHYWLSGWHLRDVAQMGLLGDPGGLFLVGLCLPLAALRWRRLGASVVWLGAAAALYVGWAALVVPGIPYPYDWDLTSWVALPVSVFAAALVALLAQRQRLPRAASVLLVLVAAASQLAGMAFLLAAARPPPAFGPRADGLRLGVIAAWHAPAARPVLYSWIWLRNEAGAPVAIPLQRAWFELLAEGGEPVVAPPLRKTLFPAWLAPGESVPVAVVALPIEEFKGPLVARAAGHEPRARWGMRLERGGSSVAPGLMLASSAFVIGWPDGEPKHGAKDPVALDRDPGSRRGGDARSRPRAAR